MYKKVLIMTLLGTIVGTGAASADTHTIEADGLRKRAEANATSTIQGLHYTGDRIDVVSTKGEWAEVQSGNHNYYVHSSYIRPLSTKSSTQASVKMAKSTQIKKQTPTIGKSLQQKREFITPVRGQITQNYGPASGAYGYTFHNGIDVAAPVGTPAVAVAEGTVERAGWGDGYGNYVLVKHNISGKQYLTLYAHLDTINVHTGQKLKQGNQIGGVGSTGNSTGPHLHFEIHEGAYRYSATNAATSLNPKNFNMF